MRTYRFSPPKYMPESFEALCRLHMPRTIHDKVDFENTVEVLDWVAVRAHTEDQKDYAETLGELVTAYETTHGLTVDFELTGLDLLKEIVKQSRVTQRELASIMGIEQGTVSKVMTGARSITVEHAKRLAKHFKVTAAALLEI